MNNWMSTRNKPTPKPTLNLNHEESIEKYQNSLNDKTEYKWLLKERKYRKYIRKLKVSFTILILVLFIFIIISGAAIINFANKRESKITELEKEINMLEIDNR